MSNLHDSIPWFSLLSINTALKWQCIPVHVLTFRLMLVITCICVRFQAIDHKGINLRRRLYEYSLFSIFSWQCLTINWIFILYTDFIKMWAFYVAMYEYMHWGWIILNCVCNVTANILLPLLISHKLIRVNTNLLQCFTHKTITSWIRSK